MSSTRPTHVILFCHGSSDPQWSEPFRVLTRSLQDIYDKNKVHLAFLERCEPSLVTLVEHIAKQGPAHVKILPVFLSSGKHLREDVPPMIKDFNKQYQDLSFETLPPVGQQDAFIKMLETLVGQHLGD